MKMDLSGKLLLIFIIVLLFDSCQQSIHISPKESNSYENEQSTEKSAFDAGAIHIDEYHADGSSGLERDEYRVDEQNIEANEPNIPDEPKHSFQCLTNKDCPSGLTCFRCKCQKIECQEWRDCAPPGSNYGNCNLRTGKCAPPCECRRDGDCAFSDGICEGCMCLPRNNCTSKAECPSYLQCISGKCSRIPCQSKNDCPNNSLCGIYNHCESLYCKSNSDCFPGLCVNGDCKHSKCNTNRDCPYGSKCNIEACLLQECKTCLDCSKGFVCANTLCFPE